MREAEVQTSCSWQTSACPISFQECAGPFSVFQPHGNLGRVDKLTVLCGFLQNKIISNNIVR